MFYSGLGSRYPDYLKYGWGDGDKPGDKGDDIGDSKADSIATQQTGGALPLSWQDKNGKAPFAD